MSFATIASRRIQMIRVILIDLHDPSGVYFHRAWSACLAGFMAAVMLYAASAIAEPLLVIAALIFMHMTSDRDRPRRPTVLLGSLIVVLLSTNLLVLTRFQPVLQALVLIGLGFLAQYLTQFGQAFAAGTFVWILSVVASAENPTIEQLPLTCLNLVFGFLITYLCYFWVAPYRPHRVLLSLLNRTRFRLTERLQRAVARSNFQYSSDLQWDTDLDRRIVSLMTTQDDLLKKVVQKKQASSQTIACDQAEVIGSDRQMVTAQGELFEAILVLEQSLLILKAPADVPLPLQIGLTQLSRQTAHILGQAASLPAWGSRLQLDSDFEQWLHNFVSNRQLPPNTQVQRQNTYEAIQTLLLKVKGAPDAVLVRQQTADVDEPPRFCLDLQQPIHRRAVRTAIAILLAVATVHLLKLPHGDWVVISAFIVSRDTIGNTLWKAKGRLLGTIFGAIAAMLFYLLIRHHHSLIFITAFLTIFPYLYLRPSIGNYGYAKFFQQFAFICFLGALNQQASAELIEWRTINIAIGCILGIAIAIFVLPNWAQPGWRQGQFKAWTDLHVWFEAILSAYQSASVDRQQLKYLNRNAQSSVFKLDQHLASRQQELMIKPKEGCRWAALVQSHAEIIQAYRRLYQSILYFSAIVQGLTPDNRSTELSKETEEVIQQLTIAFDQIGAAIGTRSPLQISLINRVYPISDIPDNREKNLPTNEQNVLLQINLVWEAIAHYSEIRNQFLSRLRDHQ